MGGLAATGDQAPALSNRLEEAMHAFHFGFLRIGFDFRVRFALIVNSATLNARQGAIRIVPDFLLAVAPDAKLSGKF